MLDSHPRIFLPPETFFFVSLAPRIDADPAADPERAAAQIASRWWIRDMGLSVADILRALEPGETSWLALFVAVVRAAARGAGADDHVLGEKTPRHVRIAEWYLESAEDARVVQILRDPRAVLASFRRIRIGTSSAAIVGDEWVHAVDVHRRLLDHPRYLSLHYEALVHDPESEMRRVLEFLGLALDPAVLRFNERERPGFSPRQPHHQATLAPLTRSRLDAWRDELDARAIRIVETVAGDRMAELGYAPAFPQHPARPFEVGASRAAGVVHRSTALRLRQLLKRFR